VEYRTEILLADNSFALALYVFPKTESRDSCKW
jgi:hypothetical protein